MAIPVLKVCDFVACSRLNFTSKVEGSGTRNTEDITFRYSHFNDKLCLLFNDAINIGLLIVSVVDGLLRFEQWQSDTGRGKWTF